MHEVTSPQAFEGLCVDTSRVWTEVTDALKQITGVTHLAQFAAPIVPLQQSIIMFRTFITESSVGNSLTKRFLHRTISRKHFQSVETFIAEPDSRAQCAALEDNVKEFGVTYFGMKDRRQGIITEHITYIPNLIIYST